MKLALIAFSVVGLAVSSFGQGGVIFKNFGSGSNGAIGNQFITLESTSARLAGAGYSVQLYYGAQGAAESSLTALAGSTRGFLTGNTAGLFGSPTLTIPGIAIGSTAALQIRVWDNAGGTVTSYEAAEAALLAVGKSSILNIALGNPADTAPGVVPTLVGLTSFSIAPVPEPGVMSLAAIGALGLLALRRKNA